jgi:hypothetical protein
MALGEVLGRLIYNTEVDPTGVDTGMAHVTGKVRAAMDQIDREEGVVKLRADDAQFKKDLADVEARRKRLEAQRTELEVTLGKAEFDRQYRAVLADVARLKLARAEIRVRVNYDRAALSKLRKDSDLLEKSFDALGRKILSARVNIGPFTLSMRQLIPILSLASTVITSLVGSLGALIGSLGEAVAGLTPLIAGFTGGALAATGLFLAIKPLTSQLSDAGAAMDAVTKAQIQYGRGSKEAHDATVALKKQLQAMHPEARKTFSAWQQLKSAFADQTEPTRNNFFALTRDAIRTSSALLPTFTRRTNEFSRLLRAGVGDWLEGLRSRESRNILDNIMGNFNRNLPTLLHGLGQFGTALGRILSEASNFLGGFVRGFDRVGTNFADATEDGDKLHATMRRLADQTHSWFALLGATGRLLITVFTGGAREGQKTVDGLTDTINEWNRSLQTLEGRRGLREFFEDSRETAGQFLSILRRLLSFLFQISRILEPITRGVLAVATALADVVTALLKFKPLRSTLIGVGAALGVIWGINKITAFIAATRTAISTLRSFVGVQATATATSAVPLGAGASATTATGATIGSSAAVTAAGTSGARTLMQSFARGIPIAAAAVGLSSIIGSVIEGDTERAAFQGGGAIAGALIGGIAGAFVGNPLLGAALGSGVGSLIGGLFGGNAEEEAERRFILRMRGVTNSLRRVREASQDLRRHRRRDRETTDKVAEAERRLTRARERFGDGTRPVIRAERRLAEAKREDNRVTRRLQAAERLSKLQKDAARDSTRQFVRQKSREIEQLQNELRQRRQSLRVADREGRSGKERQRISRSIERQQRAVGDAQRDLNGLINEAGRTFGPKYKRTLDDIRDAASNSSRTLRTRLGGALFANKRETENLTAAVKTLRERGSQNFDDFSHAGRQGLIHLGRQTNAMLRQLGIDQVDFGITRQAARRADRNQRGGEVPRAQQGMTIVPGQGSGDKVHMQALVEPNEGVFVMNRNAMGALAEWNHMFPRFARGGRLNFALGPEAIPPIQYAADHDFGNRHVHITGTTTPWVVSIGRRLQRMGFQVGEHPAFGGVLGQHSATGGHYDALAIDVNSSNDETRSEVARIARLLGGRGGGIAEKLARVLFRGPPGALTSAGQGSLDNVREAADRYIRRHSSFGLEASESGGIPQRRIAALWRQIHGRFGNSRLMSAIAMAESSGNPAAHGPPDGRGLYQIEWPIWGPTLGRFGNPFNALANTRMAGEVLRQQGLGAWVVYNTGAYRNFLQKGGPLKRLRRGGGGGPGTSGSFDGGGGRPSSGGGTRPPASGSGRRPSPLHVGQSTFKPYSTPWRWERRQRPHFARVDAKQADLREKIDLATRRASFASSHFGEETSPTERAKLIKLNKRLLGSLQRERRQARRIFRDWKKEARDRNTPRANKDWIKQHIGGLRARLEELQGRTGEGGEIFDVKEVLAGLRGDAQASAEERALQQTAFGQARFDLLRTFGGNFSPLGGVLTPTNPASSASATPGPPALPAPGRPLASTGSGESGQQSGAKTYTVNNFFATQPSDPHTWSRNMQFELGAMG